MIPSRLVVIDSELYIFCAFRSFSDHNIRILLLLVTTKTSKSYYLTEIMKNTASEYIRGGFLVYLPFMIVLF